MNDPTDSHSFPAQLDEAEGSFPEFFRTHYKAVLRFFRMRGFASHDAEDLTQETFLRVYKGWESFTGDAKRETWCREIAWNVFKNHLRDSSAGKRSGQNISYEEHSTWIETAVAPQARHTPAALRKMLAQECTQRLRAAIDRLPRRMKQCVLLRDRYGMKYREIAEVLKTSIETVKSHLYQAKGRLRREVGDCFDDIG